MNSQASPDSKPRRSAVDEGQVRSASDMGDVHSNPLPYLLNLETSSFPLSRRRIQRLAWLTAADHLSHLALGYRRIRPPCEVQRSSYSQVARGMMDICDHSLHAHRPRFHRFRDLKKYFHVVDNMLLQEGDKLAKISPMYENMGKRLRQWGIFNEALSIDECMVPYYGHYSCKMFIKGKPIRFGFKVWMMTSSSGYPYAMQIYAGKESDKKNKPLGLRVVKHMVSYLNEHNKYHVYFDNFFTSHHLIKELTQRGIKAMGTI
ncbi:PiggyBac transposable element-derived protein 3 [Trichinella sp. T8]|nr:PiggyBac transposable element-derived protein 3 [Trichinella sp. T8]